MATIESLISGKEIYAVRFVGIDGRSTTRFKTLKAAAAYVKARFLGSEYVRGDQTLQDEFGYYVLIGFSFRDLGKRVPNEDGYPEFRFYEEFGGDLDPLLDPTTPGDYSICEVHPHFHPSFDYVTGTSFKTVCRATTAGEARKKLARLYEKLGDNGPDDFNPYAVFFKGKQVYLHYCDGDPARQAAADLEQDRYLKLGPAPVPATAVSYPDDMPF